MNKTEIKRRIYTFALAEMRKHDLFNKGWSFTWNKNKTRLGVAKFTDRRGRSVKRLEVSEYLLPIVGLDKGKDTVLHEIAHILVGPEHDHNYIWRRKAREIGSSGKPSHRFTSEQLAKIEYKWYGICPNCEEIRGRWHRRPSSGWICAVCRRRGHGTHELALKQQR